MSQAVDLEQPKPTAEVRGQATSDSDRQGYFRLETLVSRGFQGAACAGRQTVERVGLRYKLLTY